ncbi:MAG: RNA polymerase sigma factor [Proteocatella sp.]
MEQLDKAEFTERIIEAQNTLYHVSKTILGSDTDCEDAVQNAILIAYEKIESLRQVEYFKTWIVRILINECYKLQKKRIDSLPYEEYFSNTEVEEKADYSELYIAISKLPVKIRITIILYYIEGYSIKEISKIQRIPSGTVKSRLSKGRKMLKHDLEEMEVVYA